MKTIFKVIAVVLGVMSFGVHAEETAQPVETRTPVVRIGDIQCSGSEEKYAPEDFPKGVFILAGRRPLFSKPVYSEKVGQLLSKKFQDKGFKISSTQEEADAVFYINSSIDFTEIEKNQNDNLKRGLSIVDNIAGVLLGAKLSNNRTVLTNGVNLNLHKANHALGFTTERKGLKDVVSKVGIASAFSEDTPEVSAILVSLMFDEWAKVHLESMETKLEPKEAAETQ